MLIFKYKLLKDFMRKKIIRIILRIYKRPSFQGKNLKSENAYTQSLFCSHLLNISLINHTPHHGSYLAGLSASPTSLIIRFSPLGSLRHSDYFKQPYNHHLACSVFHLKLQIFILILKYLQAIWPTYYFVNLYFTSFPNNLNFFSKYDIRWSWPWKNTY